MRIKHNRHLIIVFKSSTRQSCLKIWDCGCFCNYVVVDMKGSLKNTVWLIFLRQRGCLPPPLCGKYCWGETFCGLGWSPPLRKKIRQALFEWLPKLSLQKNINAILILILIIIIIIIIINVPAFPKGKNCRSHRWEMTFIPSLTSLAQPQQRDAIKIFQNLDTTYQFWEMA